MAVIQSRFWFAGSAETVATVARKVVSHLRDCWEGMTSKFDCKSCGRMSLAVVVVGGLRKKRS